MSNSIWAPEVQEIMEKAKAKYLFPSPADWRDHWIYFIMIDRFNNPDSPPKYHPWDGKHGVFQGGNFKGILAKLDYLKELGVGAIWLSPVFKNCQYNLYTYHGYGFQDFLKVDPRFGTEEDLQTLIQAAHAKGIYVIFDIVLNHAGDVFEYEGYSTTPPWRDEPYTIYWRDETGQGREDWTEAPLDCHEDTALWPKELRHNKYFRRKGKGGEAGGDFDTLKYVQRDFARIFGNAIREFALSIGKKNFLLLVKYGIVKKKLLLISGEVLQTLMI